MKLHVWDFGWAGALAIVAESVEVARKIILENNCYHGCYAVAEEPQVIDFNTPYESLGDT
jgi:hypothetical protein